MLFKKKHLYYEMLIQHSNTQHVCRALCTGVSMQLIPFLHHSITETYFLKVGTRGTTWHRAYQSNIIKIPVSQPAHLKQSEQSLNYPVINEQNFKQSVAKTNGCSLKYGLDDTIAVRRCILLLSVMVVQNKGSCVFQY